MDPNILMQINEIYRHEVYAEETLSEAKEDEGLTALQKIRKRNKRDSESLVSRPGGQTDERRSYHKAGRGEKKEKGAKSAFGTMRHVGGPYNEETLSDAELADITQWVSSIVSEGYDLDDYSDEELYAAYLEDLNEGFKPTNYTHGPNIFHGRGKKAQQIDRQVEKFKKTGDVRAQQIDFVNRMMDDPEGRKESIAKSRENRMRSTNRAREDAKRDIKKHGLSEELDLYDIVSEYLVSEGFCDSYEDADVIMANISEEWRKSIVESAKDQSDKQIEKGIKTTYKAGNVLDNRHQGRSRGLNRIDPRERDSKVERMRARLDSRRDDLFKERNKREDEKMEKIKKLLGL